MPLAGGVSIHNSAMHNGDAARDVLGGVCGLDASGDALVSQSAPRTIETMKNVTNGIAGLDASGKIGEPQLPTIFRGVLFPFAGSVAPTGFLMCDGAAVSRTTYADLFTIISTNYGIGDGSTTFNVPDMRGNAPVGIGASGVVALGDVGGEQTHTLIAAEAPPHTHSVSTSPLYTTGGIGHPVSSVGGMAGVTNAASHNNMQPYVAVNYIIKT